MNPAAPYLEGKRIAFLGKLGAMTRKEAGQLAKQHGAIPVERWSNDVDLVVIGADEMPDEDLNAMLGDRFRDSIRSGKTTLVHEHELWVQLGVVEDPAHQQLYTPAMVAGLIKTRVSHVRRWHRMGLLHSTKIAHRLPYFDFEQVQCARRLMEWGAQGAKPSEIKRQLHEFGKRIENRSLLELDLVFDGRRILLRDHGKLLGAHGQLHLDFDLDASEPEEDTPSNHANIRSLHVHEPVQDDALLVGPRETSDLEPWSRDDMLHAAEELEDAGRIDEAIEWYRVILSKYGPHAEIAFQLAELLYRSGDVGAARERYYNAVEIDEDFVEARANLGCVLAELGQIDLAIAAFEGALARDDRYPDVHYHLARSLDEVGKSDLATRHWVRFLQLSPQSPWADEALERLGKL